MTVWVHVQAWVNCLFKCCLYDHMPDAVLIMMFWELLVCLVCGHVDLHHMSRCNLRLQGHGAILSCVDPFFESNQPPQQLRVVPDDPCLASFTYIHLSWATDIIGCRNKEMMHDMRLNKCIISHSLRLETSHCWPLHHRFDHHHLKQYGL